MAHPKFKTAVATYGHTASLKDGTVTPASFAFDFEEVPVIIQAFRRMVRGLEFDISEMAITTYLCARAHGKRFTAIPVFPMRGLHHGAILYNANTDVRTPKDLEGKKVGVNRGYTVTTGLWARSILQDEYGVDLDRITWVLSGDEHVVEYRPPSNVVPIAPGQTFEDLFLSGELVAAVGAAKVEAPHIKPLIPDAQEAGLRALRGRGLYPINHTIVVRDELLDAHPTLAADIFHAFSETKRRYVDRLRDGSLPQPTASDRLYGGIMEMIGDPLPYGIEPNRLMLEAVIRHSVTQHILARPVAVDDLFARGTHHLTA